MEIPISVNTEGWLALHFQIRPEIRRALHLAIQRHQQFSFQLDQKSQFKQPNGDDVLHHQQFFQPRMQNILNFSEIDTAINQQLAEIDRRIQEFLRNGSGWRHRRAIKTDINVARYRTLWGGTYVKLPSYLANKKAIIDVQILDMISGRLCGSPRVW